MHRLRARELNHNGIIGDVVESMGERSTDPELEISLLALSVRCNVISIQEAIWR
jgi:hypothetical protein